MISGAENAMLEQAFMVEEVFGALGAMNGNKAPGPDSFTMAFFQHCWSVMKGDVMANLASFFVLGQFEKKQVGYLRCVLLFFKVVLGLRVNLRKSELILVGEVQRLPILAIVLGCLVSGLPVSYLGLLLRATFKEKSVWDGVVEWVKRYLADWKRQYLLK
ncbi:hypothetical protein ACSBR1_024563 [Camellia fascicularis]